MLATLVNVMSPRVIGWLSLLVMLACGGVYHVLDARAGRAEAISQALAANDRRWNAEIEKASRAAAQAAADQQRAVLDVQAKAEADMATLKLSLAELEAKNAALPNGRACGLDAGRVRLLPP